MEHADMTAGGASAFDVVLRGYDRRQVDDHLASLEQRLAATAAQASELRGQRDSAAGRVRELEVGASPSAPMSGAASGLDGFGAHVESILRVATEEAAAIRRQAEEEGRERALAQEHLRATFQGIAGRLEPLVSRLEEESAAARGAQSEIGATAEALHKSAQEQAGALVAAVKAAATHMRSEADARVEVAARQSADVREELALVRQVLTGLGSQAGQVTPDTLPQAAQPSEEGGQSEQPAVSLDKSTAVAGAGGDNTVELDEASGPVPVVTAERPPASPGRNDEGDAPTETFSMPAEVGNRAFSGASGREGSRPGG